MVTCQELSNRPDQKQLCAETPAAQIALRTKSEEFVTLPTKTIVVEGAAKVFVTPPANSSVTPQGVARAQCCPRDRGSNATASWCKFWAVQAAASRQGGDKRSDAETGLS